MPTFSGGLSQAADENDDIDDDDMHTESSIFIQ